MSRAKGTPGALSFLGLSFLFFVSGATALSAEVVLNKLLTYVFGSSHLSTSTVLAAYMAGLSAGAFLLGRLVSRLRRPVLFYGLLELFIGLFYAVLPSLFGPFQRAGIALARPLHDSPVLLTGLRFGLSFLLVFVPTLMMGGTLPTLVSAFRRDALERRLPILYAVNTLGAAAGTLLTAYAAIPAFGLDGTLHGAAIFNLAVSAVSVLLAYRMPATSRTDAGDTVEEATAEAGGERGAAWHLPASRVFVLAYAQGTLSFALEVVWFHLIGTVIGVTAYAFALMLFAILLGIGLGSFILPVLSKKSKRPPASLFTWAMLLFALGVALSLRGWDEFPTVIGWTSSLQGPGHFWHRELVRLAFCLAMLLPATLAMGIALPSLVASARVEGPKHGAWVGRVFAANTLGTITGSLLVGFVLLGRVGSEKILSLVVAAALLLGLAGVLLARPGEAGATPSKREKTILAAGALCCGAITLSFGGWDPHRLTLGSHYHWWTHASNEDSEVVFLREDAQNGFITVMKDPSSGIKRMTTNGKYEGSDEPVEFQDMFAVLGGLYIKSYERAALVGLGPARTLSVLHAMPFQHIEAIEYSPAIIQAAYREFPQFAKAPFDDTSRVRVVCDDGRNHLQLSPFEYDYVAVAITAAAFAGVGNIYSRDFFHAVKEHLTSDGVFMLWIQIHHVFPEDVRSVVFTLRSVFPQVHFYTDPGHGQGFLFASEAELTVDPRRAAELDALPKIRDVLGPRGFSVIELVERSIFTTEAELERYFSLDEMREPPRLLTDLDPAFEYSTPFALSGSIQGYPFERLSDKHLPRFDPPLSPGELSAMQGRRYVVAEDPKRALELYREAKRIDGGMKWDWVIERLEREAARQ